MRRIWIMTAAVGLGTAFALAILFCVELALRMSGFQFSTIPQQIALPFSEEVVQDMNNRSGRVVFEKDPDLLWRLVPGSQIGTETVNTDGFFGSEVRRGERGSVLTMLCLGDSCTALGLTPYPTRVERDCTVALGRQAVKVLNGAVPGYTSLQGRRLLNRLSGLTSWDVVTFYFGWNDHWKAIAAPDKTFAAKRPGITFIQNALARLRTYQLLLSLIRGIPSKKTLNSPDNEVRVSLPDFEDNMRAMIAQTRNEKAIPLLLTAPMDREMFAAARGDNAGMDVLIHETAEIQLHDRYNDAVRRLGRDMSVDIVDLARIFQDQPKTFLFMEDGFHLGPVGAQLVSDHILEFLMAHELLDKKTLMFAKTRRVFTSSRPHLMTAQLSADRAYLSGRPGEKASLELRCVNTGDTIWNRESTYSFAMVRIGISLLDMHKTVITRDYARFELPFDCHPGDSFEVPISLVLPESAGRFFARFDLVNEGIGWFSKWGSSPLDIECNVNPE